MLDLYRTQNKRMRVTSHTGQLRKTSKTLLRQLIDRYFPGGLEPREGDPPDDEDRAWLRQNPRHQETIQVGLDHTHEAGQKDRHLGAPNDHRGLQGWCAHEHGTPTYPTTNVDGSQQWTAAELR